MAAGGIVTRPTYALIGKAWPEAVIPLSRGAGTSPNEDVVRELREIRREMAAERNQPLHAQLTMNDDVLIDAWTSAKRSANKAGIPFGGDR